MAEETALDIDNGGRWGSDSIPFAHPFTLKGVTYRGVTLRVPSGADVARFYEGSPRPSVVDFAVGLLQDCSGTPLDKLVFSAMHGSDAAKVIAKASAFLGDAP